MIYLWRSTCIRKAWCLQQRCTLSETTLKGICNTVISVCATHQLAFLILKAQGIWLQGDFKIALIRKKIYLQGKEQGCCKAENGIFRNQGCDGTWCTNQIAMWPYFSLQKWRRFQWKTLPCQKSSWNHQNAVFCRYQAQYLLQFPKLLLLGKLETAWTAFSNGILCSRHCLWGPAQTDIWSQYESCGVNSCNPTLQQRR